MLILDFDLDFIVRPIRKAAPDKQGRYDGPDVTVWPRADFRSFLEERLHLSPSERILGRAW